jgi:ADP-heptose:LPS heptosyltransferase
MWLMGARKRVGFPIKGSEIFLHEKLREPAAKQHRVESYRELGRSIGLTKIDNYSPRLDGPSYRTQRIDALLNSAGKPIVCAHLGAGQPTRLWPERHWREMLEHLRRKFEFQLILVTANNLGQSVEPLADASISELSIQELVDLMSRSTVVLCHDSGPMHVAAACGTPTIAFFGPGDEHWFRPWGENHTIVRRDICPYKPCFDFCRFRENYCLTNLLPRDISGTVVASFYHLLNTA